MTNINLNQQQFFEKNYLVNSNTFPSKTELNDIIYTHNFNQLLVLIKNKILSADVLMQKFISITNQELVGKFHTNIVEDVQTFLKSKEYTITYVEDANNNITGWKCYWK